VYLIDLFIRTSRMAFICLIVRTDPSLHGWPSRERSSWYQRADRSHIRSSD